MSAKRQFTAGDWRVEPRRGLENYEIVFEALYLALVELVALKALKDSEGKTADYEARQPAAWEAARAALALVERRV
jgi:hypothetical protein